MQENTRSVADGGSCGEGPRNALGKAGLYASVKLKLSVGQLKKLADSQEIIDEIPLDWNLAMRLTIAKLYRVGVVGPALLEPNPDSCPGFAIASNEPHWPGKLDLFITYSNVKQLMTGMPPGCLMPED
ncbi:hypothetical protein B0H67DRAFT_649027 [Lasiosphaeris hirsuta]|uniref:Uncharacterized protein n=1 Tax=Lasiosphaeris hirsuta TaxID=260670 RepID=A0AA39ZVQ9_9PEZI|nr:hypothetical protein B0H67DRAFT_649027 [Lasiosphaeris hirsuta]